MILLNFSLNSSNDLLVLLNTVQANGMLDKLRNAQRKIKIFYDDWKGFQKNR